jgi:ATP-dependent Lhr-like helicase
LTITGPATAGSLADDCAASEGDVHAALVALESEGVVLRGCFERQGAAPAEPPEWCDRRLLARIHRYTLNRLRAEIEPVSPADFMRFLFVWQHVAPSARLAGVEGLRQIVAQLDGYELAAKGWERYVLPSRLERYDPTFLDMLCLTGEVGWGRFAKLGAASSVVVAATPVALFLRELASYAPDETALLAALGQLVAAGTAASDGFAGLRTIIRAASGRRPLRGAAAQAGRWSLLRSDRARLRPRDEAVEGQARVLLKRYGVVFRRMLLREANAAPWRDLVRAYRRLEARGEIRGGRFVSGMSGEQFALPDAVERLREIRRSAPDERLIVISGADPLNLTGVITSDERVRASTANRIVYRNGVALAAMEGGILRTMSVFDPGLASDVAAAAAGRHVPVTSGYVGAGGRR